MSKARESSRTPCNYRHFAILIQKSSFSCITVCYVDVCVCSLGMLLMYVMLMHFAGCFLFQA
jgi:hypothetical protein